MSRHTKLKGMIQQGYQDYSEQQQQELDSRDQQCIEEIYEYFNKEINFEQVKRIFLSCECDYDLTFDKVQILQNSRQKKKKDKELKSKQKQRQRIQQQKQTYKQKQKKPALQQKTKQQAHKQLISIYNSRYQLTHLDYQIPKNNTINVIVIGHVDSGKSTLIGKLTEGLKMIDTKLLRKYQKQSKIIGKQSFVYAWFTDQTKQQRQRGVTIDIGLKRISTKNKEINLLDAPGHKDFVPNMITGAIQADHAILVIDVISFQVIFTCGQIKQHLHIVKSFGVQKIIVAINKMDLVDWDKQKYLSIVNKMSSYAQQVRIQRTQIQFIPISGIHSLNIFENIQQAQLIKKKNKTLIQILDMLQVPIRQYNRPFRMIINNVYQSTVGKLKGHIISGQIKGGILQKDKKYLIQPANIQVQVKDFVINQEKYKNAAVGDNVQIAIKIINDQQKHKIFSSMIMCSTTYPIPVAKRFIVQIFILDIKCPLLRGIQVMAFIGSHQFEAKIKKHIAIIDPKNIIPVKKNPRILKKNDCAHVQIQALNPICLQLFQNFKSLGRIILRQGGETVGVGSVIEILQ